MKKVLLISGIIFVVLVLLIISIFQGAFFPVNKYLEYSFAGEPDKTCVTDSDCSFKSTRCPQSCSCGDETEAVNKKWGGVWCPFPSPPMFCGICDVIKFRLEVRCIENQCQRVELELEPPIFD